MRSTSRMTGASMCAVMKFVADVGRVCADYQDLIFVNLKCKRIQCDEIWSFVGAKAKNASAENKAKGWGDAWTWVAIDTETKLVPCWLVGPRDAETAMEFIHDLKDRLTSRVQLTTDGNKAYIGAIDNAFKNDVDFAQLVKLYGNVPADQVRYSPAACIGIRKNTMTGRPDERHISTSYIERQNLTMRMNMRRFTRLTNGHSKKLENHGAAIALFYMHYNFCRVHATLKTTPAMAAGVADRVFGLVDIADMLDVAERLAA